MAAIVATLSRERSARSCVKDLPPVCARERARRTRGQLWTLGPCRSVGPLLPDLSPALTANSSTMAGWRDLRVS